MDLHYRDEVQDYSSDEEVFLGKFTHKEAQRILFPKKGRQTVGYVNTDEKNTSSSSLKLIETRSMPDIIIELPTPSKTVSNPILSLNFPNSTLGPEDSFLQNEKMIANMCDLAEITSGPEDSYLLNQKMIADMSIPTMSTSGPENSFLMIEKLTSDMCISPKNKYEAKLQANIEVVMPTEENQEKTLKILEEESNSDYKTPIKGTKNDQDEFLTPASELKTKTPCFKTPMNTASQKRRLHTPKRYQNVISPVAAYIKKCPVVPLYQDVHPKKPLGGVSSIPKPIKHTPQPSSSGKENIKHGLKSQMKMALPLVAYKSAKKTQVTVIPDEGKLPQNHWAKQVASAIPRALVTKHNHREMNSDKRQKKNEESFENLSLHQADLSLCTQKSAFAVP